VILERDVPAMSCSLCIPIRNSVTALDAATVLRV
jgi:hypothetical protein